MIAKGSGHYIHVERPELVIRNVYDSVVHNVPVEKSKTSTAGIVGPHKPGATTATLSGAEFCCHLGFHRFGLGEYNPAVVAMNTEWKLG